MEFVLADGVSECYLMVPQGKRTRRWSWARRGDKALLGVVTLEILGLVLDPFSRELRPMRMLLV